MPFVDIEVMHPFVSWASFSFKKQPRHVALRFASKRSPLRLRCLELKDVGRTADQSADKSLYS
jgi:hypothetical protein